jgi:ApbE superfamily uncharacterized protein (UPF0280 family)
MYQPRTYRHWVQGKGLVSFHVVVKETDLHIRASRNLEVKARSFVLKYRRILEKYINLHSAFTDSIEPVKVTIDAPTIITEMAKAATKVGVGPMAAVAGAIAQFVGEELLLHSPEVIIENGGDIYLKSLKDRIVAIYAGGSPLSGKIGLEIKAADTPLSICTSSGTVGHSLSLGKADAVVVTSKSAALADAAATAIGNTILSSEDIQVGIESVKQIEGLLGVVIIKDDKMGIWGNLEIFRTNQKW